MIHELSREEFQATASQKMRLVEDNSVDLDDVPLHEYVERCIGLCQMDADVDDVELHYIYMNDEKNICHVGLNFGDASLYLVLVVDTVLKRIMGHTVLDFSPKSTSR